MNNIAFLPGLLYAGIFASLVGCSSDDDWEQFEQLKGKTWDFAVAIRAEREGILFMPDTYVTFTDAHFTTTMDLRGGRGCVSRTNYAITRMGDTHFSFDNEDDPTTIEVVEDFEYFNESLIEPLPFGEDELPQFIQGYNNFSVEGNAFVWTQTGIVYEGQVFELKPEAKTSYRLPETDLDLSQVEECPPDPDEDQRF